MNSKETLTCNLFQLPQDIFRVIFQFLSVYDLMDGEEAFLNNQELLSLFRSSLEGFTLKEEITIKETVIVHKEDELISWVIDHKLLVETLHLFQLRDLEMNLLNQSRSSLTTIRFSYIYPGSDNSIPARDLLGHFPSLTSVTFSNSNYFTNDKLISFFSHNPQLEIVKIDGMRQLSNEILPHLSNSCPNIKILLFSLNDWVNDETMSLLIQQGLFPNLKSLDIEDSEVTDQESLRQFILSRPLLSCLSLPDYIEYSDDFLVFCLRQVIFPSILRCNNNNDFESRSLAISSLCNCVGRGLLDERNDVVNPEIFSVDILSRLYHKDCSFQALNKTTQVFCHLSKFPSMIDSILQSQFIPFLFNHTRPDHYLPSETCLLFHCGVFHDYFPLFVEKYQTHPNTLIEIFYRAIRHYFSLLRTEELQIMIPIVLNQLQNKDSTYNCLEIISTLLQQPSSQYLIDPNTLLISFKSIKYFSNANIERMVECLKRFISVDVSYQQLFIESNLFPQIMTLMTTTSLIYFTDHCLLSSGDGSLVDHLVDSGLFQYLLSKYWSAKSKMVPLFKLLIEFKNDKYSQIVREMELPNELRSKLF